MEVGDLFYNSDLSSQTMVYPVFLEHLNRVCDHIFCRKAFIPGLSTPPLQEAEMHRQRYITFSFLNSKQGYCFQANSIKIKEAIKSVKQNILLD